jgi:hypothetical protein
LKKNVDNYYLFYKKRKFVNPYDIYNQLSANNTKPVNKQLFVSFCIITIGSKPDETNLCIESIRNNFRNNDDYEIIVVGNNLKFLEGKGCKLIEDNEFIEFL